MQETSNIIEDTFSAYNICKGRIFEEINKGTAWALGSEKYIKQDSFLKQENFFVNGFWQLDPKPPNRMSDKLIAVIDKYLKGLYA